MFPFLGSPPSIQVAGFNTTYQAGISSTLSVSIPSEAAVGDLLVFFMVVAKNSYTFPLTVTPPGGVVSISKYPLDYSWGPLDDVGVSEATILSFYRVVEVGDTSFTFTANNNGADFLNMPAFVLCVALKNTNRVSPVLDFGYVGNFLIVDVYSSSPLSISCGNINSGLGSIEFIFPFLEGSTDDGIASTLSTPSGFTQISQGLWESTTPTSQYALFYRINNTGNNMGTITSIATKTSGGGGACPQSFSLSIKR